MIRQPGLIPTGAHHHHDHRVTARPWRCFIGWGWPAGQRSRVQAADARPSFGGPPLRQKRYKRGNFPCR
jgi:hypothetical protein